MKMTEIVAAIQMANALKMDTNAAEDALLAYLKAHGLKPAPDSSEWTELVEKTALLLESLPSSEE